MRCTRECPNCKFRDKRIELPNVKCFLRENPLSDYPCQTYDRDGERNNENV